MLLPAVAGLLVVSLGVGAAGATQVRIEQAARAAARELARGESDATAVRTARRLAGDGAAVTVGGDTEFRRVRVSADSWLPALGGGGVSGLLVLTAEAEARAETGGDAEGGQGAGNVLP